MTWDPISQPCDYILLQGQKSPGIAHVTGAASARKWQEREGPGLTGSLSVYTGRGLAKFKVRLVLCTPAEWEEWHRWKPLVDKVPTRRGGKGKDTGVMDIWHPFLAELDIKAAAVEKVYQPVLEDDGQWSVTIDFIEFRHPKLTLAKPAAAAASPVDPIEENIIKPLTEQLQKLAADG